MSPLRSAPRSVAQHSAPLLYVVRHRMSEQYKIWVLCNCISNYRFASLRSQNLYFVLFGQRESAPVKKESLLKNFALTLFSFWRGLVPHRKSPFRGVALAVCPCLRPGQVLALLGCFANACALQSFFSFWLCRP